MPDTLKQLGRGMGDSRRDIGFLQRRGGLLPAQERTRGNLHFKNAFNAQFDSNQQTRRVNQWVLSVLFKGTCHL